MTFRYAVNQILLRNAVRLRSERRATPIESGGTLSSVPCQDFLQELWCSPFISFPTCSFTKDVGKEAEIVQPGHAQSHNVSLGTDNL